SLDGRSALSFDADGRLNSGSRSLRRAAMRSGTRCRLTYQMSVSSRSRREDEDERALLAAACAGDERAFGVLLERYRPELEEFCGLMLGDPQYADDAMGEAALTAWRERGLATTSP